MSIEETDFSSEFRFKTSRSSGKGGQNVNKVSSKVQLDFDVVNSLLLNETQKAIILTKAASKITTTGILQFVVQIERSQLLNKNIAIKKFYSLLASCFVKTKKRIATKPSKAAKAKRINDKKQTGEKKKLRKADIKE